MAAKRKSASKARKTTSAGAPPLQTGGENAPVLSIGIIFKNDHRCLARCLAALAPLREALPCQLVMADTGSTDGSRAIAEQYADIVFDFAWIDDFAAARNAVMDRCTGRWFLSLDTDEYLHADVSQLVSFLLNKAEQYTLAYVNMRNYSTLEMRKGEYSFFYALRLVSMSTHRRFVGAIHETFSRQTNDRSTILKQVIFDHDGYAKEIFQKKCNRNMLMLEAALAAEPEDLRRIVQCIESCQNKQQAIQYCNMVIDIMRQQPKELDSYGAVALYKCIHRAYQYNLSAFSSWYELAVSLCPDSPFIMIDSAYLSASYYLEHAQPQQALAALARYFKGIADCENENFAPELFCFGTIQAATFSAQESARLLALSAHVELEQWEQALQMVGEISLAQTENFKLLSTLLAQLLAIWRKGGLDGAQEQLVQIWQSLQQDTSDLASERRRQFQNACKILFTLPQSEQGVLNPYPTRQPTAYFSALGYTCEIGIAAMVLETDNTTEITSLLDKILHWEYVPVQLLLHLKALDIALPEAFFCMNTEDLSALADDLITHEKDRAAATALEIGAWVAPTSPAQVIWVYNVTLSAITATSWELAGNLALCRQFCNISRQMMDIFYPPALLCEEYLHLLPAPVRFAWHYNNAEQHRENNQLSAYVHALRAGLAAAPFAKGMVKFLLNQTEIQAALQPKDAAPSHEMMQLARAIQTQVATLRAQSNPAAELIEQSEQYLKLLPLINQLT